MKILVTGATGSLGQELCPMLEQEGWLFWATNSKIFDITNTKMVNEIINKVSLDFIIHLAAYTNIDLAETHKQEAFKVNHIGTKNLAKIAKYIFDNGLELDKFIWFTESRKMCRAGYRFATVDVDGTIFPCHGFMYIGDTHKIANIRDIDRIKRIQELSDEMEIAVKTQHPNGECEACDVRFCTRCPAGSATLSKDLDIGRAAHYAYINRFTCSVFKLSDRIAKALIYAKNRNRTN